MPRAGAFQIRLNLGKLRLSIGKLRPGLFQVAFRLSAGGFFRFQVGGGIRVPRAGAFQIRLGLRKLCLSIGKLLLGVGKLRFHIGLAVQFRLQPLIFLPERLHFLSQGRGGILRGLCAGFLGRLLGRLLRGRVGGLLGGFGLIQFLGQLIHLSGQRPGLIPGGAVLFVGGVQFQFAENSQRQGHGQQHRQHDDPNLTFLLHG